MEQKQEIKLTSREVREFLATPTWQAIKDILYERLEHYGDQLDKLANSHEEDIGWKTARAEVKSILGLPNALLSQARADEGEEEDEIEDQEIPRRH